MRIAQASVALALCLLVSSASAQTQTPPAGSPMPESPQAQPAPPAGPATPAPGSPQPAAPPATTPGSTPTPVAGRALTLDEAIAIALETQPQIKARLADYLAAAYRVDQAFSVLLPQLTGQVRIARTQSATLTASQRVVGGTLVPGTSRVVTTIREPENNSTATVSLSQVVFDFGKTFASTDAARRLAEQAQEDVELQRQTITQLVKNQFINLNFAKRLIRVQEQSLERADLNLKSAKGFFEVGTRPKSDVARAEVDVANARVDLIQARNSERLARVALNTAMGLPAETPTEVQDNLVFQAMTLDHAQLLPQALAQRPDYKQARLRVDQVEAQMRRAFRDFFPDVVAGAFYGGARADLNEIWEVSLSLQWTIFDGGNRIARWREFKANVDSARATVRATELDISRDVEQSYLNVTETQERIGAAQTAVASAQENFRLAQGRFDAGVGTILELTDAQLFLTQAQNTEAKALADYRIAVAALEKAIGRR